LWQRSTLLQIKKIAISPHSYIVLKLIVRMLSVHMFILITYLCRLFSKWLRELITLKIHNNTVFRWWHYRMTYCARNLSKTRNGKSMFLLRWWTTAYSELVFFSSHLSCIVGHNKPHERQSSKYVSRPIWNNVNVYVLRSVVCYVSVHEISETIAVYQIAIKYFCEPKILCSLVFIKKGTHFFAVFKICLNQL